MKCVRVRNHEWLDISNPGDDGVSYRLLFTTVEEEQVGTAKEQEHKSSHRLAIRASRSRTAAWKLSAQDLEKVLFGIVIEGIEQRLKKGMLQAEATIRVNTKTHSPECPFDPRELHPPGPLNFTVAVDRMIGF